MKMTRGVDMYHYESCGLDGIYLKNGYQEIEINGEISVSITALDSLHEAIATKICESSSKLSGKEIRFLRIELDMSQKGLGVMLEKTDQAVAKWEKDENVISRGDDVTLRSLYLESRNKDSKLGEILNRFNELDRELQEHTIFMEEAEEWNQVAC